MARLPHQRLWYSIGVVLALYIVVMCLVPPRDVPYLGLSDKIEHAAAFAGLATWFGGLLPTRRHGWLALALFALGAAIEMAQGEMHLGRSADVRDLVADSWGIAFGLTLCALGLRHWAQWVERWWR